MKKQSKGFTLVELLAVIVILAVIILIAINAVLPQMTKARKNSFADEVMNYAKAAETKYVADSAQETDDEEEDITKGVCYTLEELNGEYVSKNDSNYSGIVIIKQNAQKTTLFDKFVYIANKKYNYSSTNSSEELTGAKALKKISNVNINDGGKSRLTYQTCEAWEATLE